MSWSNWRATAAASVGGTAEGASFSPDEETVMSEMSAKACFGRRMTALEETHDHDATRVQ